MKITVVRDQYLTYRNYYELEMSNEEYKELMKLDEIKQERKINELLWSKVDKGLEPRSSNLDLEEWGEHVDWWEEENE